jgi:hypothetical protein
MNDVEMPVVCNLDESGARTQIDEWRELLQSTVATIERKSPTRLAFRLNDNSRLTALVDLAQRELTCCPFLEFSVQIDADRVALQIASPEEAATILDGFASLAG